MGIVSGLVVAVLVANAGPLTPGDHVRQIDVGGFSRTYFVHVPPSYDPTKPTPVVLAFHPFATNALVMAAISGLNQTADRAGFLAVYPNGTGRSKVFLAWTEGGMAEKQVNDLGFVARVLDDLEASANVDRRRVYATGMSNGAMMCHRVAAEFSDRIAAIATIAGTMAFDGCRTRRPVPVLHFHGTDDTIVPFGGPGWRTPSSIHFKSVDETVRCWIEANRCPEMPAVAEIPRTRDDGLRIERRTYGPGRDGAEVVLYVIEGGGHTWPGREFGGKLLGKSALDLPATELMWEFFERHPMK